MQQIRLLVLIALIAVACRANPEPSIATEAGAPATTNPVPLPTAEAEPASPSAPLPTTSVETLPTTEPTVDPTPTPMPTPTPTPGPQGADIGELLALSSLQPVGCPDDVRADQVSCAVATLPLDIYAPVAGENVDVLTAFVDNGDPNGTGPVVFLQGGPGVGSLTQAPGFVGGAHDLLLVDQRGTGYSTPKLNCPEVDDLWLAQYTDDPAVRLPDDESSLNDAYRACGARLAAEGIDFDHFNTASAAVDFELLRQLYGHDVWSIWGISSGTRLGLTIMRDHPAGVRSAVLDSIVPFEVDFFATIPENGIRAMTALDQACDVDRCSADHGDFLDNLS